MTSFDLLGVKISEVNLDLATKRIFSWIEAKQKVYVCVAPVATIMDCQDEPRYREIINAADMTTPDGMPIVWMGKYHGSKVIDRTYGPDLMRQVFKLGVAKGVKHFFYGGTTESLKLLVHNLKDCYSGIQIVGTFSPGHIQVGDSERDDVLEIINQSAADVLWVGLGSPKQDYWMAQHRSKIVTPVMVGAGAAFDFLAGIKPQAPRWIQRSGLEWLFRLCSEPRRLWRRYLLGNPRFIALVLVKELLKRKPSAL